MIRKRSTSWSNALALVVCLALVAGAQSAQASGKTKLRERVDVQSYERPSWALSTDNLFVGTCNPGPSQDTYGCVRFNLSPKDRDFMLEVKDDTGGAVFAMVWSEFDDYITEFCGATESPIPNPGGDFFYVEVVATNAAAGCVPSTATSGEVEATFTTVSAR